MTGAAEVALVLCLKMDGIVVESAVGLRTRNGFSLGGGALPNVDELDDTGGLSARSAESRARDAESEAAILVLDPSDGDRRRVANEEGRPSARARAHLPPDLLPPATRATQRATFHSISDLDQDTYRLDSPLDRVVPLLDICDG